MGLVHPLPFGVSRVPQGRSTRSIGECRTVTSSTGYVLNVYFDVQVI